ncbi:MAG: hypothetical protein K8F91_14765 [Candidatus Obscuribacterales bacterium]|nr:hypothetical protein [Candidatus Obscuribacterales bacterium]
MDSKKNYLPSICREKQPGVDFKPERVNTIQDVVDTLSYGWNQIWDKEDITDKEVKYYRTLSDWGKHMIAAIKERDAHSPEKQAKELEERLRISMGAKMLGMTKMHEVLLAKNFGFALEQYVDVEEVIEIKQEEEEVAPTRALLTLKDKGLLNHAERYFASEAGKEGSNDSVDAEGFCF